MYFKRLLICLAFAVTCGDLAAQVADHEDYALDFSVQHLGPFEMPPSNVDSNYWSSTGTGWIESMHVADNGQTLFAGTISSGLFHSEDGGENWQSLTDDWALQYGVLDMVIDKKYWYVATGLTHYDQDLGTGVLRSADKGKTWEQTGLKFEVADKTATWCLKRISRKCLLAATNDRIYRTTNRGEDWQEVYSGKLMNFRALIVSKHRSKLCVASGSKLLTSKDAGKTWIDRTHQLHLVKLDSNVQLQRIAIAEDPNIKGRFLALYSHKGMVYVDESTDDCATWTNLYAQRMIKRVDINHAEIAIAPGNSDVIVIGSVKSYVSKDGGKRFEQMSYPMYKNPKFVHDDVRSLYLEDSLTYYLGTDGGIFKTSDGGQSWKDLNGRGLTAMMVYGIGLVNNGFMVGCQDLGTFYYQQGKWLNIGRLYGDGGDILQRGDTVYSLLGGSLRGMSAKSFRPVRYQVPRNRMNPFTTKLIPHSSKPSEFYMISDHLHHFDGRAWHILTDSFPNRGYKATAFAQSDTVPQIMYFAFDQPSWGDPSMQNKFLKSTDGGANWVNITTQLPILQWKYISSISCHGKRPQEVCVSLGMNDDTEVHKVYKTTDGGKKWVNWSEGLPPLQTFKIAYIKGSKSAYLVSSVAGLYIRTEWMDAWKKIDPIGLPAIAIRDFEQIGESADIYLSTYGRGVYKLEIFRTYWE